MPSATGTEESCLWGSLWLNSDIEGRSPLPQKPWRSYLWESPSGLDIFLKSGNFVGWVKRSEPNKTLRWQKG